MRDGLPLEPHGPVLGQLRGCSTHYRTGSTGRREASFRPEVEIDGVKTRVMVEQLTVVDPEVRLGEFAGRLESAEMHAVDQAMLTVLGLD